MSNTRPHQAFEQHQVRLGKNSYEIGRVRSVVLHISSCLKGTHVLHQEHVVSFSIYIAIMISESVSEGCRASSVDCMFSFSLTEMGGR